MFGDLISDGGFSGSQVDGLPTFTCLIEKGETEQVKPFYFFLSRMLSRKIPVSLTRKSSSLSGNRYPREFDLPSPISCDGHLFPFSGFLSAFQMLDLETEVIPALIMGSQVLTTSFSQDEYWEEFGSKLYDEGGALE